ncbi:MAG: hypothetical protein C4589_10675 [Peptococcaceae bacterium]|nr:MAG: hypothetical protein C4589_10675 [Peptococcaceae bacterium]
MNFDKEKFSQLLQKAKGSRSINNYGQQAKVDPGYISRLLREKIKTPPSPGIIKKLAGNARNEVSYEELMIAAGYLPDPHHPEAGLYKIAGSIEQKVAEALQKPLADFLPVKKIPVVDTGNNKIGPNQQKTIGYLDVPRELEADFAFKINEDAMLEAGIFRGDTAICRQTSKAAPGEMVSARLSSGKVGIRYLDYENGRWKLIAANSRYRDEEIDAPEIKGIVLMVQKEALKLEQFKVLQAKDEPEGVFPVDFLLEKLSAASNIPLKKLKTTLARLKSQNP